MATFGGTLFANGAALTAEPPPRPPLPVPRNLPFQLVATGIHSSILMSESLEGLSVAWIRQKAGRFENGLPGGPPLTGGGVKAPAATFSARVIIVLGRDTLARSSQAVAAPASNGINNPSRNSATGETKRRMSQPLGR